MSGWILVVWARPPTWEGRGPWRSVLVKEFGVQTAGLGPPASLLRPRQADWGSRHPMRFVPGTAGIPGGSGSCP